MRDYFEQVDWNQFNEAIGIEDKWGEFMNIYTEGVRRFVLKIRKQEVKKQEWPGSNGRKGKQMKHEKNIKRREVNTQR